MSFKPLFLLFFIFASTPLIVAQEELKEKKVKEIVESSHDELEIYEEFALSEKREETLKKLIPGTEIYYYLHTLYFQQNKKIKEAGEMLIKWEERLPNSFQIETMKNRQALLSFDTKNDETYQFIKNSLNLNFEHEKPRSLSTPFYPNNLNPDLYNYEIEFNQILDNSISLDEFTEAGLYQISKRKLNPVQLKKLLEKYPYCDLPNMVGLILQDFKNYEKQVFGNLDAHKRLTLAQLKELKNKKLALINHDFFVKSYLAKLNVDSKNTLQNKPSELKKYMLECWSFSKELNPSFNTLKANILFAYLKACLELNQPDFVLFKEYLKFPRQKSYANTEFYKKNNQANEYIQYDNSSSEFIQVPPINSDEKLVETYLFKLIKASTNMAEYQIYFKKEFFNKFEAETKIKTGLGKPEDFYTILQPADLEKLKNSVEISFVEFNAKSHLADEPIKLFLQIKNVSDLEIHIFKLNMLDFYRTKKEEIQENISFEGYIPNFTKKFTYKQPSYIRHEELIDLPEIETAGTYIIELLGNGIKTRTFIKKGNVFPAIYESNSGHEIQLFDDRQNQILDYAVYFEKHEIKSNKNGMVIIPYAIADNQGNKKLIFSHKDIACLHQFNHQSTNYQFSNLILNTLESLTPGQNCKILFTPVLKLNDKPIDFSIISDVKTHLVIKNAKDDILSSQTIFIDKLKDLNELTIFIPEDSVKLDISLIGNIKNKAEDEKQEMSTSDVITLTGAFAKQNILGIYLRRQNDSYQLECLNKAGIPQANITIQLILHHQYLDKPYRVTLQTNQKGIANLNKLTLISYIEVDSFNSQRHFWSMSSGFMTKLPSHLAALENEILEISISRFEIKNISETFLLLKKNGNDTIEDKTADLKIDNEMLKIPTNSAGDYTLFYKYGNSSTAIHILKGKKQSNYFVTENTISDIPAYLPHQIILETIDEKAEIIKGKILYPHKSLKAYLWSGRYYYAGALFLEESRELFNWPFHQRFFESIKNQYFASIQLSSEQKYIFDRKNIQKFPGNLLMMPSALLNPWDTSLAHGNIGGGGGGGGSFGTRHGEGGKRAVMRGGGSKSGIQGLENNSFQFLPNTSILEIAVQKDGSFEVSIKNFKDQKYLQIGVISPYGYAIKELPLLPTESKILDIRQIKSNLALDSKLPAISMTAIQPEKPITFIQGEEKEILFIDTLTKLLSTLTVVVEEKISTVFANKLDSFHFLCQWNSLTEAQKLIKYKEYACHEVHFFIYRKDPLFFNSHIKPFLKNKQAKSFVDQWLLEEDLSGYLSLNKFNQLNLFEKILLSKRHPDLKGRINSCIKDYLEINKPNRAKESNIMERLLNTESGKAVGKYLSHESAALTMPIEKEKNIEKLKKETVTINIKTDEPMPLREIVESEALEMLEETVLYRDLSDTKEYVEANYYYLEKSHETSELIKPNLFWLDYLNNSNKHFISENILSFTNFHEVILALAVTDIPEISEKISSETKENQITLTSKTPLIVLLNSYKPGVLKPAIINLQQHYFIPNQGEDKKEILIAKKNPFLINKKYGCLTVITNTTSDSIDFDLNTLIPEGSLPLGSTSKKERKLKEIGPFSSSVFENEFFFPLSGTFSHLPGVAVDFNNSIIFTNEKPYAISATADEEALDKNSWEFLVKEGNKDKIIAYLKTRNILKTKLEDIYYLVKDKTFFEAITTELKAHYYFDYTIWSFSVYHKDKNKLMEFLPNTDLANSCGTYFASTLLNIDPIEKRLYEHKEYFPLIKGRTHPVEKGNKFENLQFEMHYSSFIQLLMHKPSLNSSDLLNVVIYVLNQQRISEALKFFVLIKENEIAEKLQYDYLKGYLAFYQEDLALAEKILVKYKDLAIPQWKERFDELGIQLNEIKNGKIDTKARGDKFSATVLAEKEAVLKTKNNLGTIEITYKNLKNCRVDYYLTDLEILFSNAPFEVLNNQFQFLTAPNFSESITLDEKVEIQNLKIPENLKNKNLVVKVVGAGKESVVNYYPNQMDITLSENYGELRVISSESKKPLSGVYVKVYGDNSSNNEFIKDGYTDLRGIFNYTSVSGKPISQFKKLAILIISEKSGASIHYTTPPAQ